MRQSRYLYDEVGNCYERKNLYLLELIELNEMMDVNNKEETKAKIKKIKENKNNHEYNIRIKEFKKKEMEFLGELKRDSGVYSRTLDSTISKKKREYIIRLFKAENKYEFYRNYIDLSYDIEFEYRKNEILLEHIPYIIKFIEKRENELIRLENEKKKIDDVKEKKIKEEIVKYKIEEKEILNKEISRIKDMRKEKIISKKAENNEITQLKKKYKRNIDLKSYDSNRKSNLQDIKNIKQELKIDLNQRIEVLKSDIADMKRKIPAETHKSAPWVSNLTFLTPGLGQILNKQYIKGALLSIISLFIYFIAIPYSLGYGNYQGQGIYGLMSLAMGGKRIDKSLIFMIEGILSIYLLIISIVLMYLSFKDVRKVEIDQIRGIRPNNFYETGKKVKEEGFPYLVSLPALIVIIFTVLVPITTTTVLSFTGMDPKHQSKFGWAGIENYKLIALGKGLAGEVFWHILFWTIIWTILATTLAIVLGFVLALLVNNERIKGKTIFRSIFILPWAVPAFISIMFFSIMFSPTGALTEILTKLIGKSIEVKSSPTLTRAVLILLQGWLGSSYVFLLTTGVLQAIPGDLYEAADIDGATAWEKMRRITLPIVLFQTAPLLVGQYTFNFNNFSIIFLFNGGGPFNPSKYGNLSGTSDLLISYIYKLTMDNQFQAIGAAITTLISIGLMIFAYIGYRNSKAFKEDRL